MDRRSAIRNMILLASAPAIIKIDMLMPVKSTPFSIDYTNRIITVGRTSGKNSITASELYNYLQDLWDDEPQMDFKFSLQHPQDVPYILENNWIISDTNHSGRM